MSLKGGNPQVTVNPLEIIESFVRMMKMKNSKEPLPTTVEPEQTTVNTNDPLSMIIVIIILILVVLIIAFIIYNSIKNKSPSSVNRDPYYNDPYYRDPYYNKRRRSGLTFTF